MEHNKINKDVKIAYIVLCHMDDNFVAHLAKTLQYKNDGVFIHVDGKVDIKPFKERCEGLYNVHFVSGEKRVDNFWGGYNSIVATFNTIELALKTDDYDRFVLLQGHDYPIVSNNYIHRFFSNHLDVEFCKASNISVSKKKISYMKIGGYWHFDNKNIFWKLLHKFNTLGIKYRPLRFRADSRIWDIYSGWAHFALTRGCVEYCLDNYHNNIKFNRFMRHRFPPDELYIPTIIYNSPYAEKIDTSIVYNRKGEATKLNLTYFEYPDEVKIRIFKDKEDYEFLKKTGCLYARKINSSSYALIEEIDKHILSLND